MSATTPTPATSPDPLVNEVRMLLDFITGSPVQTLKDLTVPDPDKPQTDDKPQPVLRNTAILNRLNDIETSLTSSPDPLGTADRTFLQLLRDALGSMVRPATGLTIAYSSLVVGRQRGRYSLSRAMRAENAYPSLVGPARRHRWAQRLLLAIAVAVTGTAVWESAHVALGRSLLQSVQALHTQQATISQEMTKLLEANRPAPLQPPLDVGGVPIPAAPIMRLCDRPAALAHALAQDGRPVPRLDDSRAATLFESPAQQSLCDRDTILAAKFAIAHDGLLRYMSDWRSVISPGHETGPRALAAVVPSARAAGGPRKTEPPAPDAPTADQTDVDFAIGPVLLVLGNYVLPIVFALLGATVYVILDFYSKLRDSLLAPRDAILSWIRLVLGMVLGACVGLFFSTANPSSVPAGAALAESITLSASGLAFIAGFGVEGVFGMLDSLVRRVFSGDQDRGAHLSPG